MKISEIMKKAIVVDDSITLKQASNIMSEKSIGSLIVVKNDVVLGILTESDVVKDIEMLDKKLSELMTKNLFCVEKNAIIEDAARLMKEHKIKRLPVMDNKKLTGVVTATDIIEKSNDLNEDFFFD